MLHLTVHLLGAPQIICEGVPIEVDTRKAIALVAYLAVKNAPQTRDSLAAFLWPDYDQSSARAALRRTLSTLNKALGESGLDISRETIALQPGNAWVDVNEFHHLLALSADCINRHPAREICPECLPWLEKAVELYRDDFLSGFTLRDSISFDDWQFFETENLRRELAGALEKLAHGYLSAGEYERSLPYVRRWLSLDQLNEEAHRLLMRSYAFSGQRNAALRQYRECVRILDQELGVPPLEGTTQLYEAIKEQKNWGEDQPITSAMNEPASFQAGAEFTAPAAISSVRSSNQPFVGRKQPWSDLNRAHQDHASGYWVALSGEAGIGKTRLAEEFLERVRTLGGAVFIGRCYEGEAGLAYGPILEALNTMLSWPDIQIRLQAIPKHWLSEAARLLPEIATFAPGLSPNLSLESPGAQTRFFEGLRQVISRTLAGTPTGVLFLDDLHWIDAASLDLLTYLVRRLPGSSIFILATWRNDSSATVQQLQQLCAETERAGTGKLLNLARLNAVDLAELIDGLNIHPPATFTERLYQESEGLPFFAVEYLKMMAQGSESNGNGWEMPHSVRDLLRSRLASAGETGGQLLSTAAVIGRSFDFDTLQACSGRSELEVINGLEALLAQGLVTEHRSGEGSGQISYDFSHDKLRSLVYEETSLSRQRLLHRRVAEALVSQTRNGREVGAFAGQIALHYQSSGQEALAAEYYRLAGEHARQLYANREGISHFQAALALGYPAAAQLHEAIGDLRTLLGEYHAAITSYETAAALCTPVTWPRLEHKLGNVYHRLGEWEQAASHFSAALEAYGREAEPCQQANIYADWSRTAHNKGETEMAAGLAHQALTLAQVAGDHQALAQAYNILGILARGSGKLDEAGRYLEQGLAMAESLEDPNERMTARIATLNNLAMVLSQRGEIEKAIELTQAALDGSVQLGDRHREAALHNNLADLYYANGQSEQAMAALKKAVVIFSEIGEEAGSTKPEIWKLSEW